MPKLQKDRLPRDYSSGTVIFVQKLAPGTHIGEGYLVEIYENAIKVDEIKKRTKKDVYELIKDYKRQYNTNRAFQNEIEVFVTYPTKNERGETAMSDLDTILYKKANKIGNILKRIINPENPVITRKAEDLDTESVNSAIQTPSPSLDQDVTEEELADTLYTKIKEFIVSNQDKDIDELYNKVKQWLFKVNDRLKIYNNMVTANIKQASGDSPIDYDKLKSLLLQKIDADPDMPEVGIEVLNMKPGNLEGVNEDGETPEEASQESEEKAANFIDKQKLEFWKFASNVVGSNNLEDIFYVWGKQSKLSNGYLNVLYAHILNDVDELFGYKTAQLANDVEREQYLTPFINKIKSIIESEKDKRDIAKFFSIGGNELMKYFGELFSKMVIDVYLREATKAKKNPVSLIDAAYYDSEWSVAVDFVMESLKLQMPRYQEVLLKFRKNFMEQSPVKESIKAKCQQILKQKLDPNTTNATQPQQ